VDEALRDLARAQHGVFSRAQARDLGYSRGAIEHRLQKRRWEAITAHVLRVTGAPATARSSVMATVLSGGPDAIASAATGLALHGVRDFGLMPAIAVVGRRPPRGALSGVRESFRILDPHRTIVDGIPSATAARALFDAARGQSPRAVARMVDTVLAARKVTIPDLEQLLTELAVRGRPGIGAMRVAIEARSVAYRAPESALEDLFVELVREHGLPEPARQVRPRGAPAWIDRVDFVWSNARLVVETDGGAYHDSPSDRANDERRDRALERAGWTVLRFGWNDVAHRPTSVVRVLGHALTGAA